LHFPVGYLSILLTYPDEKYLVGAYFALHCDLRINLLILNGLLRFADILYIVDFVLIQSNVWSKLDPLIEYTPKVLVQQIGLKAIRAG
jgi:hypothetical protein